MNGDRLGGYGIDRATVGRDRSEGGANAPLTLLISTTYSPGGRKCAASPRPARRSPRRIAIKSGVAAAEDFEPALRVQQMLCRGAVDTLATCAAPLVTAWPDR
jgi:hypothetical protein